MLNIKHGSIDVTLNLPDIAKKKLSVEYRDSYQQGASYQNDYCPDLIGFDDVLFGRSIEPFLKFDMGIVTGWAELCVTLPPNTRVARYQIPAGYHRELTTNNAAVRYAQNPGPRIINGICYDTVIRDNYYALPSDGKINFGYFDARADVVPGQSYDIWFDFAFSTIVPGFTRACGDVVPVKFTVTAASSIAELKLNDQVISAGLVSGVGTYTDLVLNYDAPYADDLGAYGDATTDSRLLVGGSHVVVVENSKLFDRNIDKRKLLLNRHARGDDERALTEALYVTGLMYFYELGLMQNLLSLLTDSYQMSHIGIGIFSQADTYRMDITLLQATITDSARVEFSSDDLFSKASRALTSLYGSGLENGVFEQLQGVNIPAVSTIKWLHHANQSNNKVFKLDATNFATVKSSLSGYSSAILNGFQQDVISGHTLYVPQNGSMQIGEAKGHGYLDHYPGYYKFHAPGMLISGGLNGGGGSRPVYQTDEVADFMLASIGFGPEGVDTDVVLSLDPVNMYTGEFYYNNTDLSLGGSEPEGLKLARTYRSGDIFNRSFLSHGWSHNYEIEINTITDPKSAFGQRRAVDAAPQMVSMYVMLDTMLTEQPGLKEWMACVLVSKWAMDQLQDNARIFEVAGKPHVFTKMPDGTFNSPIGVDAKLIKISMDIYQLEDDAGDVIYFNSDKKISRWVDVDGNEMTFDYVGGKLKTVTDAYSRTLTYNYEGDLLDNVVDSTGRVVEYGYDFETYELVSYTDADSHSWIYGYDELKIDNGYLGTITNPESNLVVKNIYNGLNQVTRQIMPRQAGARPYQSSTAEYKLFFNGFRNVEQMPTGAQTIYYFDKSGQNIGVQDALGYITTNEHDGQSRVVKTIAANESVTRYHYDDRGNLEKIIDDDDNIVTNKYNINNELESVTDALGSTTSFYYDDRHRLVRKEDSEGRAWQYSYFDNGLLKTVTNPENVQTQHAYDDYGHPPSTQTGALPAVQYAYDPIGRMETLTDQVSNTTQYTYTYGGLPKVVTDPFGREVSTVYWDDGNVKSVTDRNIDKVAYTYTVSGKLETVSYPDESVVRYYYDTHDRLREIEHPQGTTFFEYDLNDQVSKYIDVNGFETSYTYTDLGRVKEIIYPGGRKVSYEYNNLGLLNKVTDWLLQDTTYNYDKNGRLIKLKNFNDTVTTYTYNKNNEIIAMDSTKNNGEVVNSYTYKLNRLGNRIEVEKTEPEILQLPSEVIDFQYNPRRNRLKSVGANVFTYDAEGQQQTAYGNSYDFDYNHHLTNVSGINTSTQYTYDVAGRRVQAVRDGVVTKYIYDVSGNLLAEADANDQITQYYVYGNSLLSAVSDNGGSYVYHFNGTGSTVAVTDSGQNIINSYIYTPYGQISSQQEGVIQPFKYIGAYGVIAESEGVYYMRARYYDSKLGRFIKEDPIGRVGGLNLYAYASANPLLRIDPRGTVDWVDLGFGVVDFTLSTAEAGTGWFFMVASPVFGPAAPVSFTGGLFLSGHGALGMANSALAIQNALNEESGPSIVELVGGALFGETGASVGQAVDLFTGIRPGAIASYTMRSIGDVYDTANTLNTMSNAFGNNNGVSSVKRPSSY